MKNFYELLVILLLSISVVSCSKEEGVYIEPIPDAISFNTLLGAEINSESMTLWNGERIAYYLEGQTNSSSYFNGDLSIRNNSNPNVEIQIFDDSFSFKTVQFENQSTNFDIYYREKKLSSITVRIKTLYKLQKNGSDINESIILDLSSGAAPQEFKLLHNDGKEIEDFSIKNLVFISNYTYADQSVEVFPGDNLKLYYNGLDKLKENQSFDLYYFSRKENRNIFVSTITVLALNAADCYYVNETSKERISFTENSRYKIIDGKIFSRYSQSSFIERFYYTGNKVTEIFNEKSYRTKNKFFYENDRIIKASAYLDNGKEYRTIEYFYNEEDNLKAKVEIWDTDNDYRKDSIVYKNFLGRNPERSEVYYFRNNSNEPSFTGYYINTHDAKGNLIKQDVSLDNENFVRYYEANYDPELTYTVIFNKENGATFEKIPVKLSETYYTEGGVKPSERRSIELRKVEKDENGNVISIDWDYFYGNFSDSYFWKMSVENCN